MNISLRSNRIVREKMSELYEGRQLLLIRDHQINLFVNLFFQSGKPEVLDIDEQVSTIDNQRVVILQQDDIVGKSSTNIPC